MHAPHATPTEDGAVDDDGALGQVLLGDVAEVEADGQLEVQLYRGALEPALEGVQHSDVDLGAVERAVPRVELPRSRGTAHITTGSTG